jgi:hypothetical protein
MTSVPYIKKYIYIEEKRKKKSPPLPQKNASERTTLKAIKVVRPPPLGIDLGARTTPNAPSQSTLKAKEMVRHSHPLAA